MEGNSVKKFITLAVFVMAAFGITATVALAAPGPVSTGNKSCQASGQALVNVHFTYTSPDSGMAGNNWANDTINRQLQIWKLADGNYCASVSDQGSFVTVSGPSPNNGGQVSTGITGKMQGGYTTGELSLTGPSFNPKGLATRGDLGTFTVDQRPSYLSYGLDGDFGNNWGWSYTTSKNGSWVNASIPPGNSGDITG
jgi:hypothetical protein